MTTTEFINQEYMMLDELIERLAIRLAKTNGYEIENIHSNNPRMKVYLKMAASCLGEIDNYLEEQEIEFGDLEVNARYEMPQLLNQEER
jgi:molybdate-binding protein